MADLISRQALIEDIQAAKEHGGMGAVVADTLKRYVKRQPTIDAVPRGIYDQVTWERDLAIHQLREDYGVGLGEVKKDAVPVVRCKDCVRRNPSADLMNTVLCTWLHNLSMPKDGFCSYGERRADNGSD